jgi:hypothetical protein
MQVVLVAWCEGPECGEHTWRSERAPGLLLGLSWSHVRDRVSRSKNPCTCITVSTSREKISPKWPHKQHFGITVGPPVSYWCTERRVLPLVFRINSALPPSPSNAFGPLGTTEKTYSSLLTLKQRRYEDYGIKRSDYRAFGLAWGAQWTTECKLRG